MIEAEVHQQLYTFLKHQGDVHWPHHLTIARLVARALRLNRDAILQISPTANVQGRYRLSYIAALLLSPKPGILVASKSVQAQLLQSDIPCFREWSQSPKPIYRAEDWPGIESSGMILLTPHEWLEDTWHSEPRFPQTWPLIVDQADDLEDWARAERTISIGFSHWEQLMWAYPAQADLIRDTRAALTKQIFQHPVNPYGAIAVDETKRILLNRLETELSYREPQRCPMHWQGFWAGLKARNYHSWIDIDRGKGEYQIQTAPTQVVGELAQLFEQRATVLLGSCFGGESVKYRQALGMGEATFVQFAADRQGEEIQLYLPDRIPMPNTKEFQGVLLNHLQQLIVQQSFTQSRFEFWVVIVEDTPLKTQVATQLAATLGSRVVVESMELEPNGILVTGWNFWLESYPQLPKPRGLLVATLPIPSPENPKVAARIEQYKRQRLDWFRLYLLPTAVQTLQRAIAPIRAQESLVAIYDNRILHRSYGQQILTALSPYARIDALETQCLSPLNTSC